MAPFKDMISFKDSGLSEVTGPFFVAVSLASPGSDDCASQSGRERKRIRVRTLCMMPTMR